MVKRIDEPRPRVVSQPRPSVPAPAVAKPKPSAPVVKRDGFTATAAPRPSAPLPPSPLTTARAEVSRLTELAKHNPKKAAQELHHAIDAAKDPALKRALIDQAGPAVEQIARSLQKANPNDLADTIHDVAAIAHAGSPQQARALGEAFARQLDGGLGGFSKLGDIRLPSGPGSMAFFKEMLSTPGTGDFLLGMLDGAKQTGNVSLLKDSVALLESTTSMATKSFEDAQKKVDQLNGELNALVQGFGPGDEKKLQAAVAAFKERHKDEYAKLEAAGAAMTNVLAAAGPVLAQSKDFELTATLAKALSLAPQVLQTQAGQQALGTALAGQARGEQSPLLDLISKASQGKDGEKFREQVAPAMVQALGTQITKLKSEGRDAEAHQLIDTLSKDAALFGLKPGQLGQLQTALHDTLDGKPNSLGELKLAVSTLKTLVPKGSGAATTLGALGFVVGVAGLGDKFSGFGDKELQDQIGAISSTVGLGASGGTLALKILGNPEATESLSKLFGKASTLTGVVGAMVGVIDFGKTLENGSIGDIAVSGLNAASGVLMLIPGGQLVGAGLAVASFALNSILADRRQREAERASEGDAKAFLEASGLDEDFAQVFSNLDNDKRNIGVFVEEVAKQLGLSQDELFDRLNHAKGADREKLLKDFGGLSAAGEILQQFGDGAKLPIFGPRLTLEDLKGLPDWVSKGDRQKMLDAINARRDEVVAQVAKEVGPLID